MRKRLHAKKKENRTPEKAIVVAKAGATGGQPAKGCFWLEQVAELEATK